MRRLGIAGALARTLTNTNCIESMISITRRTTRRVTKWKDGSMKKRWIAAGMLEAERSFRRVRGHTDMAKLVDALRRQTSPPAVTAPEYDQARSLNPAVATAELQQRTGHPRISPCSSPFLPSSATMGAAMVQLGRPTARSFSPTRSVRRSSVGRDGRSALSRSLSCRIVLACARAPTTSRSLPVWV